MGLCIRIPHPREHLAAARTAIFDKTGTLATGQPRVQCVCPADGGQKSDVLALAARAETGIAHPLARSIIRARGRKEGTGGTRNARGAAVTYHDGCKIAIRGAAHGNDALTTLKVERGGALVGTLSLADDVAPGALQTILALRARHQGGARNRRRPGTGSCDCRTPRDPV